MHLGSSTAETSKDRKANEKKSLGEMEASPCVENLKDRDEEIHKFLSSNSSPRLYGGTFDRRIYACMFTDCEVDKFYEALEFDQDGVPTVQAMSSSKSDRKRSTLEKNFKDKVKDAKLKKERGGIFRFLRWLRGNKASKMADVHDKRPEANAGVPRAHYHRAASVESVTSLSRSFHYIPAGVSSSHDGSLPASITCKENSFLHADVKTEVPRMSRSQAKLTPNNLSPNNRVTGQFGHASCSAEASSLIRKKRRAPLPPMPSSIRMSSKEAGSCPDIQNNHWMGMLSSKSSCNQESSALQRGRRTGNHKEWPRNKIATSTGDIARWPIGKLLVNDESECKRMENKKRSSSLAGHYSPMPSSPALVKAHNHSQACKKKRKAPPPPPLLKASMTKSNNVEQCPTEVKTPAENLEVDVSNSKVVNVQRKCSEDCSRALVAEVPIRADAREQEVKVASNSAKKIVLEVKPNLQLQDCGAERSENVSTIRDKAASNPHLAMVNEAEASLKNNDVIFTESSLKNKRDNKSDSSLENKRDNGREASLENKRNNETKAPLNNIGDSRTEAGLDNSAAKDTSKSGNSDKSENVINPALPNDFNMPHATKPLLSALSSETNVNLEALQEIVESLVLQYCDSNLIGKATIPSSRNSFEDIVDRHNAEAHKTNLNRENTSVSSMVDGNIVTTVPLISNISPGSQNGGLLEEKLRRLTTRKPSGNTDNEKGPQSLYAPRSEEDCEEELASELLGRWQTRMRQQMLNLSMCKPERPHRQRDASKFGSNELSNCDDNGPEATRETKNGVYESIRSFVNSKTELRHNTNAKSTKMGQNTCKERISPPCINNAAYDMIAYNSRTGNKKQIHRLSINGKGVEPAHSSNCQQQQQQTPWHCHNPFHPHGLPNERLLNPAPVYENMSSAMFARSSSNDHTQYGSANCFRSSPMYQYCSPPPVISYAALSPMGLCSQYQDYPPTPLMANYPTPNHSNPNYSTPNNSNPNYPTAKHSSPNNQTPNYQIPNYSSPNLSNSNYSNQNYPDPNYLDPVVHQANFMQSLSAFARISAAPNVEAQLPQAHRQSGGKQKSISAALSKNIFLQEDAHRQRKSPLLKAASMPSTPTNTTSESKSSNGGKTTTYGSLAQCKANQNGGATIVPPSPPPRIGSVGRSSRLAASCSWLRESSKSVEAKIKEAREVEASSTTSLEKCAKMAANTQKVASIFELDGSVVIGGVTVPTPLNLWPLEYELIAPELALLKSKLLGTPAEDTAFDAPEVNHTHALPIKRLLKQLEVCISEGDLDQAAALARELAQLKIQCTMTHNLESSEKGNPIQPNFILNMFVEDKVSHHGPIPLRVNPSITVGELKDKIFREFDFPIDLQKWILGNKLAVHDQSTLASYGIVKNGCPVFLYLLTPENVPLRSADLHWDNETTEQQQRQGSPRQPNVLQRIKNTRHANGVSVVRFSEEPRQHAADSVADVQLPPPVPGWECLTCTLLNVPTRPGCEACGSSRPDDYRVPEGYKLRDTEKKMLEAEQALERALHEAEEKEKQENLQNYLRLMELEDRDLVTNEDVFECSVCFTRVDKLEGVKLRDCLHLFCRDCLQNVITYSADATVKCPYRDDDYACDSVLQEREIRALVPPEDFERHLQKGMNIAENQSPNSFHCKTADCKGWCYFDDDVNEFMCPVCRHENCLTCQVIHERLNCRQYQDQLNELAVDNESAKKTMEAFEKMLKNGEAMHCPGCHIIIMKKWGCDWICCTVCKKEICWVTKGPRWGPAGRGDTNGGCKCGLKGLRCHPNCNNCH